MKKSISRKKIPKEKLNLSQIHYPEIIHYF